MIAGYEQAREVLKTEADAIMETAARLNHTFDRVIQMLLKHEGKIIISGTGKSGFIAQKIAATLTSTGVQTIFMHPTDALHGDLGIYTPGDPTILLSRSGSTDELLTLIPVLKRFQSPLVAIVGNTNSPLARQCDYVLEAYIDHEADPLALIPTTSAITALAMGDALASVLMANRHFCPEDFAQFHPGGQLGRNLLLHVSDVMHRHENVAQVFEETPLRNVVIAMTERPLGACCVVDENGKLIGVITDGDIRRLLQKTEDLHGICARDLLCRNPKTIKSEARLGEAVEKMESGKPQVYVLPVVDASGKLEGLLRLHDAYNCQS